MFHYIWFWDFGTRSQSWWLFWKLSRWNNLSNWLKPSPSFPLKKPPSFLPAWKTKRSLPWFYLSLCFYYLAYSHLSSFLHNDTKLMTGTLILLLIWELENDVLPALPVQHEHIDTRTVTTWIHGISHCLLWNLPRPPLSCLVEGIHWRLNSLADEM